MSTLSASDLLIALNDESKTNTQSEQYRKLAQKYQIELAKVKEIEQEFETFRRSLIPASPPSGRLRGQLEYFTGNFLAPPSCLHGYSLGLQLGTGASGAAFDACHLVEKCERPVVAKITVFDDEYDFISWQDEVKLTKLMGENNIGPQLVDSWVCENGLAREEWHPENQRVKKRPNGATIPYPLPTVRYRTRRFGVMILEKLDFSVSRWIDLNKPTDYASLNPSSPIERLIERKKYLDQATTLFNSLNDKLQKMAVLTGGLLQGDLSPANNSMIHLTKSVDSTSSTDSTVPVELLLIDFGDEGLGYYDTPEKVQAEIERITDKFWNAFFG